MAQQVQHSSDNVCCEPEDKSRSTIGQLAFGHALRGTAAENGLASIAIGQTVPLVMPGRVRCFSSINVYDRTCPLPMTSYFVEVNSARANGPRQCNFWVLIPISAPKPNSAPSEKRVEAFQYTAAEST